MELLPLDKLGAHQTAPGVFDFGVLLPWVSAAEGNRVRVKLIHEIDQFIKAVPAQAFEPVRGCPRSRSVPGSRPQGKSAAAIRGV